MLLDHLSMGGKRWKRPRIYSAHYARLETDWYRLANHFRNVHAGSGAGEFKCAEPITGSDACVCHAGCWAAAAPAVVADHCNVRHDAHRRPFLFFSKRGSRWTRSATTALAEKKKRAA